MQQSVNSYSCAQSSTDWSVDSRRARCSGPLFVDIESFEYFDLQLHVWSRWSEYDKFKDSKT